MAEGVNDLPENFNLKGRMIVAHGGNLGDLNFDLAHAGLLAKPYPSWSDTSFGLAAIFKNDGRFSNEQIAAALMCDLECNQHITKMKDESAKRRAVERLILRSHDTTQQKRMTRSAGTPNWREQRVDGSPIPSMHNARLAITAIGVECSYDTFHNKMLFGYKDDTARHVVQPILGEVSDDGILGLRQLLSDRFGFDLTDKHVRDAVKSLALEHCFDPVADMLDEAEANWDGVRAARPHGGGLFQLRRHAPQSRLRPQDHDRSRGPRAAAGLQVRHHPRSGKAGGFQQELGLAGAGRRGEFLRRADHRQGQPRGAGAARHHLDTRKRRSCRDEEGGGRDRQGVRKPDVRPCAASIRILSEKSATALN